VKVDRIVSLGPQLLNPKLTANIAIFAALGEHPTESGRAVELGGRLVQAEKRRDGIRQQIPVHRTPPRRGRVDLGSRNG
jgi:hypothetical protein